MQRRDIPGMARRIETLADRLQHQIRAAQATGRRNGKHSAIGYQRSCFGGRYVFAHI
jgi:hypothetical protein